MLKVSICDIVRFPCGKHIGGGLFDRWRARSARWAVSMVRPEIVEPGRNRGLEIFITYGRFDNHFLEGGMAAPTIVQMSMEDFYAPCVYAWRRNGVWLYVGQSTNGLARLGSHQVIRRRFVKSNDELLVFRVKDVLDLDRLESGLIRANRPLYNKRGVAPADESESELLAEREASIGLVSRSLLQWVL